MKRKDKLRWYRKEFESISDKISNSDNLSYLDFLRIRNFKLQNSTTECAEHIHEITKKAFLLAKEDKIK